MAEEDKGRNEAFISYLLGRLQEPDVKDDPVTAVAHLFKLKTTLDVRKSTHRQLADWCLKQDITAVLTEILSQEFNPYEDEKSEVAVYSLAMHSLALVSSVGRPEVGVMMSQVNSLCATLTPYLDTSGRFYQFGSDFQERLSSLCSRVSFPQQRVAAVPMTKKVWKDVLFYQPSMYIFGGAQPSQLYRCHLTRTDERTAQASRISAQLVNEKLAWSLPPPKSSASTPMFKNLRDLLYPSHDTATPSSPNEDGDITADTECDDVHVLEMIGGPYFWAHIGSKASNIVKVTTEVLSMASSDLKVRRPSVGEVVMMESERGTGKPLAMRGKVMKVCEDKVTVFAMDYGGIKTVKVDNVFQLPEYAEFLSTLEAQAKVCCLAGVQAPPSSVSTVHFALTTLVCLTGHEVDDDRSDADSTTLKDVKILDHLYPLLTCGSTSIRHQATRLLGNLSSLPPFSSGLDWPCFVRVLLGTLMEVSRTQSQMAQLDETSRKMAVCSLQALYNIVHLQLVTHDLFFDLKGHFIVLNLVRVCDSEPGVKREAYSMLSLVYPGIQPLNTVQEERKQETEKTPPTKEEKLPVKPETGKTPVKPETAKTPVKPETGKTPVNLETGKTPVKPETGKTPVKPETGKTPVKPETGKTPVNPETGKTLVKPETGKTPVNPETGKTQVKPETGKTPVKPEPPKTPPGVPREAEDNRGDSEESSDGKLTDSTQRLMQTTQRLRSAYHLSTGVLPREQLTAFIYLTHHLYPLTSWKSDRISNILQTICAMLTTLQDLVWMSTSRLGVDEHLKTCVEQHLKTRVDEQHLKTWCG
ncbi:hypothetical protein ACOMHN_004700 [Nucella lapillus]